MYWQETIYCHWCGKPMAARSNVVWIWQPEWEERECHCDMAGDFYGLTYRLKVDHAP